MRAEQLTPVVTEHGEGPTYSPRWGLRFVDMLAGDICELGADQTVRRRHVGTVAAMVRPRAGRGFVVAGERGLLVAEDDDLDSALTPLVDLVHDDRVRLNEGGCDPGGRLFVGSMAYDERPDGGTLYRVDPSGSALTIDGAVSVSNGIDWAPDGGTCYYNDSPTHRIDQFDWSEDTGLSRRRPLVADVGPGVPDGLTVDADGNVWTALFGGGQVRCYSPHGLLLDIVEVDASQVTAVTFADEDLGTLIITTSRNGIQDDAEPAAGALFMLRPGVRGQPARPFAR